MRDIKFIAVSRKNVSGIIDPMTIKNDENNHTNWINIYLKSYNGTTNYGRFMSRNWGSEIYQILLDTYHKLQTNEEYKDYDTIIWECPMKRIYIFGHDSGKSLVYPQRPSIHLMNKILQKGEEV